MRSLLLLALVLFAALCFAVAEFWYQIDLRR